MENIEQSRSIYNLIKFLNSKSKPNFKSISKKLGITRQTFQNKFEKLKQKKLIKNFTININPNILPNLSYVILEIKTNPKEPYLVEELLKINQLKMLDGIFGEFSLIALFIFKSSEEFNQTLSKIDYIMAKSYFKKYQLSEVIKVYKTNGIKLSEKSLNSELKLDNNDYLILKILQERQSSKLISTYDMSKLLKIDYNLEMSQATIYNRIKKLENSNVILNYSINFSPVIVGFTGKFVIRIKPKDPSKYDEIALKLENNQNITDLFRIGEQYGLFAIIRVKKIEDYRQFIKEFYDTQEIEDTFTNFILDELKPYTNFVLY
ncbi:MAG: Lrp/AsnC ligand binding domain-containing protein [Promethearchaeota archaeon]